MAWSSIPKKQKDLIIYGSAILLVFWLFSAARTPPVRKWVLPNGCISPGCLSWDGVEQTVEEERLNGLGECGLQLEVKKAKSVPRIIHQVWFGDVESMPTELMLSCAQKNPGWKVKTWTVGDLKWIQNKEHFAPDRNPKEAMEIVRWEALARYGGVFVDAHHECVKGFERLVVDFENDRGPFSGGDDCFAGWVDADSRMISADVVGCVGGSDSMKILVEGLSQRKHSEITAEEAMGSGFLTDALLHPTYGPKMHVKVLPHEYFYIPTSDDVPLEHAFLDIEKTYTFRQEYITGPAPPAMIEQSHKLFERFKAKTCHRVDHFSSRFRKEDPGQYNYLIDTLEDLYEVALELDQPIFLIRRSLYGAMRMFNRNPWAKAVFVGINWDVYKDLRQLVKGEKSELETEFARAIQALPYVTLLKENHVRLQVEGILLSVHLVPFEQDGTLAWCSSWSCRQGYTWESNYGSVFPTKLWPFDRLMLPVPNYPEFVLAAQGLNLDDYPSKDPPLQFYEDAVEDLVYSERTDNAVTVELLQAALIDAYDKLDAAGLQFKNPVERECNLVMHGTPDGLQPKLESWTETVCGVPARRILSVEVEVVRVSDQGELSCQVLAVADPYDGESDKLLPLKVNVYCLESGDLFRKEI